MRGWRAAVAVGATILAGCVATGGPSLDARTQLAPTGKVRVGIILSNQVLVSRDPATGELRGVTVTLARALAAQLGVPWHPVGYENPAALVKSFGADAWDVAFLAYDPARTQAVQFSPPYMEVDNTYLVAPGSTLESATSADQPGVKIAVPERSAPDLFLSRTLKAAQVVRVAGGADAALDALRSGRADAYAENAHMLSLYAERLPGSRVLEGRYTVVRHAIATPKGKPAATKFIKRFVEGAKRDGTVQAAIEEAGLRRVTVAPAGDVK